MITTKKVTVEIEEPDSITCDKCGKVFSYDDIFDVFEIQEFLKINFYGGFASVFGDMTHVECDLCQRCLHGMIAPYMRASEDDKWK